MQNINDAAPAQIGSALTNLDPKDLADLRRSGLSDETIASMGCFSADLDTIRSATGVKKLRSPGYGIPYRGIRDQTGNQYTRWRLRKTTEQMRYVAGLGDDPQLYVPPTLSDLPKRDLIVITEGEKKAAKAVQEGIPCIAVQGVWSWADAGERAVEKSLGDLTSEETSPLPELLACVRQYGKVLVLGDSDLLSNPQARRGFRCLTEALRHRGLRAELTFCPPAMPDAKVKKGSGFNKQGLDDWLVADRFVAMRSIPELFRAAEITRCGIQDRYNALEFAERFSERLAYSQGTWRNWNGSIWVIDDSSKRRGYVTELAEFYRSVAARLKKLLVSVSPPPGPNQNSEVPDAIKQWTGPLQTAVAALHDQAKKLGTLRAVDATLAFAQALLRKPDDAWDRDPFLLAVQNGIVDLRTGVLLSALPDQLITKTTGIEYQPNAGCPTFQRFLERVQPDPSVQQYLQKLAGYSTVGHANEQKFFVNVGKGANGKSTFVGILADVLGQYAKKGPMSLLAEQNPDRPRNDIASLVGARMVSMSEAPENLKLDEATLKAITGQDLMSARFLYREFFEFRPSFTPILDTNHFPRPRGDGEAIWRRLAIVNWSITIPSHERDQNLRTDLLKELPGILRWVIEGAKRYIEEGLNEPPAIVADTQAFRGYRDDVMTWLDGVERGSGCSAQSSILYRDFCQWSDQHGKDPAVSQIQFTERLELLGFAKRKTHGGYQTFFGVQLPDGRGNFGPKVRHSNLTSTADEVRHEQLPSGGWLV